MTSSDLGKYGLAILTYLQDADRPQSAYDILDALRDEGVKAPMQIYRALEKLQKAGLVHKLAKSNGWIACDSDDHHHSDDILVLLSCQQCRSVAEIEDSDFQSALTKLSSEKAFTMPAQTIELDGLCAPCEKDKHR